MDLNVLLTQRVEVVSCVALKNENEKNCFKIMKRNLQLQPLFGIGRH